MTGNLCLWPSEECLSALLVEEPDICEGKDVVEVGAGSTGLAGLICAAACHPRSVLLTDGNLDGVKNMDVILDRNALDNVSARELRWEWIERMENKVCISYQVKC